MKIISTIYIFSFLTLYYFETQAQQLYIKIDQAKIKKSLVALPPFQYQGTVAANSKFRTIGTTMFKTVMNDLDVSSYFKFIRQDAFLEKTSKTSLKPFPADPKGFKFSKWKTIGTEFLIRAGYKIVGKEIELEVFAYHVPQQKGIFGKSYKGNIGDERRIAHTFANDFIEALTGKSGMFLSQIVVTSDRAGGKAREVFVMDWDGYGVSQVSKHKSVALSPAWAPDGQSVAYTAYAFHKKEKTRNADLFSYGLYSGKRFLLSSRKGINSGAAYDPLGKFIYLTLSQGGNPDIFRMTTDGKYLKRITRGPAGAMNVEPAISPDGKKIAFSSDRSGRPMIYTMNIDGTGIKRVTFAGRYNATPSWAPDSKKIAFAGWDKGHNDIFVMNPDGTSLERLTSAVKRSGKYANNEDPTFSPDGRHIMFVSDRTGKKQLYIVNVDGTNERRITVDRHNYYKPKWGWHKR